MVMPLSKRNSLDSRANLFVVKEITSKNGEKRITATVPLRILSGFKDAITSLLKDNQRIYSSTLSASWSNFGSSKAKALDEIGVIFQNRLKSGKPGKIKQFDIQLQCTTGEVLITGKHLSQLVSIILPWILNKLKQDHPNFFQSSELSCLFHDLIRAANTTNSDSNSHPCSCSPADRAILCLLCNNHACYDAVQCSHCGDWTHFKCAALSPIEIDDFSKQDKDYFCNLCCQPSQSVEIKQTSHPALLVDTAASPDLDLLPSSTCSGATFETASQTMLVSIPEPYVKFSRSTASQTEAQSSVSQSASTACQTMLLPSTVQDIQLPCSRCPKLEKSLKTSKENFEQQKRTCSTVLEEHERIVCEHEQLKREFEELKTRQKKDRDIISDKEKAIAELKLKFHDAEQQNLNLLTDNDYLYSVCLQNGIAIHGSFTDPSQSKAAPSSPSVSVAGRPGRPLAVKNAFSILSDLEEDTPDITASCSKKNVSYKKSSRSANISASDSKQSQTASHNHGNKFFSNSASTDRRNSGGRKNSSSTNETRASMKQSPHIYKQSCSYLNSGSASNHSSNTAKRSNAHRSLPSSPSRQSCRLSKTSHLSPPRLMSRTRSLPCDLDISIGSTPFLDSHCTSHRGTKQHGPNPKSETAFAKTELLHASVSKSLSSDDKIQQSSKADCIATQSLPSSVSDSRSPVGDLLQTSCSASDVSPVRIVKITAPPKHDVHDSLKHADRVTDSLISGAHNNYSSLSPPQLEDDSVCAVENSDDCHPKGMPHISRATEPQQNGKKPDKNLDTSMCNGPQNPSSGTSNPFFMGSALPTGYPHVQSAQGFRHGRASNLSHTTLLERAHYSLMATLHLMSYPKARQDPVISAEIRMLHEQVIECTQSSMKLLNLTQVLSN